MQKKTKIKKIPESFSVDHTIMPAPQVRKAGLLTGPAGDKLSKFDLRFLKPNVEAMPTAALHTLEHLLAMYFRENMENIIDLSPMGCRTGFYLTVWGDLTVEIVEKALCRSLEQVLKTRQVDVPGLSEKECGNFKDHSLFSAKEYAKKVLEGFKK